MKTTKIGLFILTVIIMVPFNLLAQIKEIPITSSSKEAVNLFITGRDKSENYEIDAAISLFEKAIQLDPDFALAYLYRANAGGGYNIYRQNLNKAISLINKISDGEKMLIQYNQAAADGNGQKQKEYLDQLLKSFSSDKRVQQIAGWYYWNAGDLSTGLVHFKKSAEIDPNFAAIYNDLGLCQAFLNNNAEAEKALQTYIRLLPDKSNPYDCYAFLLLKMGRYNESITQYKKSLEKDPSFSYSLSGLGDNYVLKGDYEQSRKYYQECFDKAKDINWKFNALFSKAVSYVHEGKTNLALSTFDEYRTLAEKENLVPNQIMSYAYQGFIDIESGKPQEGMKYYDKAIELINKSNLPEADKESLITSSMSWRTYYLAANGELDKAMSESEKCKLKIDSRKNPNEEMGFYTVSGYLEVKKGNYDKAIQDLSKGYKENPLIWYYTAIAYGKKGDKQNASKLFDKIAKWNVNSLELAIFRKRAIEELKK